MSVWVPLRPRQFLKSLHRWKTQVQSAIRVCAEEISDFNFKFHLDPDEINDESDSMYCTYADFRNLVSSDCSEKMLKFIWV